MYRAVTEGIEVIVEPAYAPERSSLADNHHFWVYSVEIRNLSLATVQLRSRHWRIADGNGKVQHVNGLGVVGEQPILRPGETYRYSSGCPLDADHGMMAGQYEMVASDGRRFEVEIPPFSLDMPSRTRTIN